MGAGSALPRSLPPTLPHWGRADPAQGSNQLEGPGVGTRASKAGEEAHCGWEGVWLLTLSLR